MGFDTIERLGQLQAFDTDVLQRVDEVAKKIQSQTWAEIDSRIQRVTFFTPPHGGKPIEVLDLVPANHDPENDPSLVWHLGAGNGLDPANKLSIHTLFLALGNARVIAAGNATTLGNRYGRLRLVDFPEVSAGEFRPTIDPLMQYLGRTNVKNAIQGGGSLGADRAASAAEWSSSYDVETPGLITIEPASVVPRSLLQLFKDFKSSDVALPGYVRDTQTLALFQAREITVKENGGKLSYAAGLSRLSNIATIEAIAKGEFEDRSNRALSKNPDMRQEIIWGSDSELAIDRYMQHICNRLIDRYGATRVSPTRLWKQKHALGNDIYLNAAIVLQAATMILPKNCIFESTR